MQQIGQEKAFREIQFDRITYVGAQLPKIRSHFQEFLIVRFKEFGDLCGGP